MSTYSATLRIGGSQIPVGMAARYDIPIYRFYRDLERILGIQLDYSKPKVVTNREFSEKQS